MIVEKSFVTDLDGTATRTVPLFRATRGGVLVGAAYQQELAADGTKTATVRNATKAVNMTAALTVSGLGALGSAAFVLDATPENRRYRKGDLIQLIYTVAVAGTVAAGETSVELLCRNGVTGELGDET